MEASQHTQLTVVKFKFKPGTGTPQDILKFPEWRQSLGNLRRIVNWRYATHGIGLNMDWDLVLFIGWADNNPPTGYQTTQSMDAVIEQGTSAFAPLKPLLECPPDVGIFSFPFNHVSPGALASAGGTPSKDPFREVIEIRGSTTALKPIVERIHEALKDYRVKRGSSRLENRPWRDAFHGHIQGWLADDNSVEDEGQTGLRTFIIVPGWSGLEARDEFKKADFVDYQVPENLRRHYGPGFWDRNVAEPIRKLQEKHDITVNSWTYHKARLAEDEKGLMKRDINDY